MDTARVRWAMSTSLKRSWEELRANVLEATAVHFEESTVHPRLVELRHVKDELIPAEAA